MKARIVLLVCAGIQLLVWAFTFDQVNLFFGGFMAGMWYCAGTTAWRMEAMKFYQNMIDQLFKILDAMQKELEKHDDSKEGDWWKDK